MAFASSAASVITKSILHPLDTVKCRSQLLALREGCGAASSPLPIWRQVLLQYKGKWGLPYLYGGLPPKLLLYTPYQAIYITSYSGTQLLLRGNENSSGGAHHPDSHRPRPLHTVLASISAELASCVVRVPMEATKMWVQSTTSTNSLAALRQWISLRPSDAVAAWRILILPQTVMHDIPYSVCQWVCYETLRPWACGTTTASEHQSMTSSSSSLSVGLWRFVRTFAAGGLSGLVASTLTIPLDHIRTRMLVLGGQRLREGSAVVSGSRLAAGSSRGVYQLVVKPIYLNGGWRGFYRGGMWRVLWTTSNMALYFPVFEVLRSIAAARAM